MVHTSVILLMALSMAVDKSEPSWTIPASFSVAQEENLEICPPISLGEPLQEIGEPGRPFGPQSEFLSLDDGAADGTDVRTLLASLNAKTEAREVTFEKRGSEKRSQPLHPVHGSKADSSVENSTIRFGGSRLPGSRHVGFANSQPLEVIVPGLDPYGANVLNQASSLSLTGGAMMVSTAKPHSSLANVPLKLEYDPSNVDGNRLTVIAGKQRSILSIYDWELQPLARFVDSGHHGAISIHMFGKHEKVSLDAAFEQTLLGLRFIQADMMPRGIIMSQDYLPQDAKGILLGPGEQERLSSEQVVRDAVHELESLMSRTRNGAPYSVMTDAKVQFEFEIVGNELIISGSPYFFFWEPANKGDQVLPKRALNDSLKRAWPKIKQANPVVIEAMERSFRAVAFFRFQKQNSPNNWSRLMQQLEAIQLEKVPTPSLLSGE